MSDETNLEVAGQPNEAPETIAKPQGSDGHGGIEATDREPQESAPETAEAIAFWKAAREANITDPKAFYADYTRKSQRAKELENALEEKSRREQQYEQALAAMLGQQRAQSDPETAAWQRLQEAEQSYDPELRARALQDYLAARDAKREDAILRKMLAANQINSMLPEIQKAGFRDYNDLLQFKNSMTERDEVQALTLLRRMKHGDLRDALNREATEREAEAVRRKRLDTLVGEGSSGAVPGALNDESRRQTIDPVQFYAMTEKARKAKYGITELPV